MADTKAPAPIVDSETSVDYYVTTVKNKADAEPIKEGDDVAKPPVSIVVSVDRAGSVKVRKRKKSKRRKKKSNLAFEDIDFPKSEDSLKHQSSDSGDSLTKFRRRSSSVSEKDFRKNVKRSLSSRSTGKENLEPIDFSAVRRRVKKKNSFKNNRNGMLLDVDTPFTAQSSLLVNGHRSTSIDSCQTTLDTRINGDDSSSSMRPAKKQVNRQDALATLDAFMVEVEEATTVAKKQQEGERCKDPVLRRSHSLTEISDTDYVMFDINPPNNSITSESTIRSTSTIPSFAMDHRKNESVGQHSVMSSVFLSDREVSIEEARVFDHHRAANTSSSDAKSDKRPRSLCDIVQATDAELLGEIANKKVTEVDGLQQNKPPPLLTPGKDLNYGITHLEQVCNLIEQIGDLRNENQMLRKRVHDLELQVEILKEWKVPHGKSDLNKLDYHSSFKRPSHPVDRIRDAISRSRKISVDKIGNSAHDHKTISQPLMLLNDDPNHAVLLGSSNSFSVIPDRPVIYSNVRLKKNSRRHNYSKDDLDLFTKGRWKFWKGQGRTFEQPLKKQVISSIKAEHTQGSAVHLKSASVTLDSLLNNLDNDFSQKMIQWQSSVKTNRASSRASEPPLDRGNRPIGSSSTLVMTSSDETKTTKSVSPDLNRPDFNSKGGRRFWEKVSARNLSWRSDHRRTMSEDQVAASNADSDRESTLTRSRSAAVAKTFHKSMPCVTQQELGGAEDTKLPSGTHAVTQSLNSAEWSAIQEAFPTTSSSNGKPIQRLYSGSQARFTSPLRKKNNNSNKRKSWSFSKPVASKYYLPSDDFGMGSNVGIAESIGQQMTLDLDNEDVKSATKDVNSEELGYLKRSTVVLREKLKALDDDMERSPSQQGVRRRPLSSISAFQSGRGARFFRPSKHADILPLSSSDVRTSERVMMPLMEEAETLATYQSLPELSSSRDDFTFDKTECYDETTSKTRRHTITVLDMDEDASLSKRDERLCSSVPSYLDQQISLTPVPSLISQKITTSSEVVSSSTNNGMTVRKWVTTNMLSKNTKSTSSESTFGASSSRENSPAPSQAKIKKRNTIKEKLLSQIHKLSPKSHKYEGNPPSNSDTSLDSDVGRGRRRKKKFHIPSFRSKPHQEIPSSYSTDEGKNLAKESPSKDSSSSSKTKKSEKITQISVQLTSDAVGSSNRRNSASPPRIVKGLVSRLSKRFIPHEVKSADSKMNNSDVSRGKSATFVSAKNLFESSSKDEEARSRALSESKLSVNANNNNNVTLYFHYTRSQ
ncbi:uncharacterized protein LOC143470135 isoform X3 [Clavelina lepadiformis]|uniref:uncharacterized protein LOC143470135 isoform X3 n=1 Tax=Clavelina lepadiformis TaxID=159417 RepID=UPI0040434AEB